MEEELSFDKAIVKNGYELAFKSAKKVSSGKNAKNKEAYVFNQDLVYNVGSLINEVLSKKYEVSEYSNFKVYDPKERIIYAPSHRDKVLQIMLNEYLKPLMIKIFIPDSYASIEDKGTERAVKKVQHNMRCAKRKWGNPYTLKLDIRKFFYTIDREVLKKIFRKHIKDEVVLYLLDKITDSAAVMGERGLPLGNTISQFSANLYLNELDKELKRRFGLRYYVRYMDDIFIQVESKEKAREILDYAHEFVSKELHLELNRDKSIYFPVTECISGLGFKIYPTHLELSKRSKKSLNKIIKEPDIDKFEQRFCSWAGIALSAECFNYIEDRIRNIKMSEDMRELKRDIICNCVEKIGTTKGRLL